jgi:hypothetical protein
MGLPGSGKSTVFAELATHLARIGADVSLYREPEESEWPDAVTKRDKCGCITALTWFRAARVPRLVRAASDRLDGKIALMDSYYDKLVHLYFDTPGFEWLMPPDDPYRGAFRNIAALDYTTLPDANCVVTFTVDETRWARLVNGRGRALDRASKLLETHHTQEAIIRACDSYCCERGIAHIKFENAQETALAAAVVLHDRLVRAGVLN